jgi:hypothetical protein
MVDNLSALAIKTRLIGSMLIAAVARGGYSLDVLALDEDDDILPVVGVTITATSSINSTPSGRLVR